MKFSTVLGFPLAATAALSIMTAAHSHDFQGQELQLYRRSYAMKHRDLASRCGAKLQSRRMRRALSIARRSGSNYRRGASEPADAAAFNHMWARSSSSNSSACLLTPEVTQGPYHILGERVQQDIRGGQPGIPLHLIIDFVDVDSCEPLTNAWIDVWGANATGYYSGYESSSSGMSGGSGGGGNGSMSSNSSASGSVTASMPSVTASASGSSNSSTGGGMGGPGSQEIVSSATIDSYTAGADSSSGSGMGGGNSEPTDGDNFMRGVWQTDDEGVLTMFSIVPGWYSGRAPHIHLKVYESDQGYRASNGTFIANDTTSHHTGQWFFPDDVMDAVAATDPYSNNNIAWSDATKNSDDSIYPYANSMGSSANLEITYINASDIQYGLIATTTVGVNTTYTSAELTSFYWDPDQSNDDDSSSSALGNGSSTSSASMMSTSTSGATSTTSA